MLVLDPTLKIVCTGSSFSTAEREMLQKWGVANSIVHIAANDAEMASLYRHALSFFFPSLYEGFGIPILEAFSNNCPVCLSNASCFPEVAGDAAMYFEPQNAQSMYDTLKEVISSASLREELRTRGAERIQEFSLQIMVRQTCDVYRKVL